MKKLNALILAVLTAMTFAGCGEKQAEKVSHEFIRIEGNQVVDAAGEPYYIQGVNLGNWLNPEGYMFQLAGKCNSYRLIDELIAEMVGPAEAEAFWRTFTERYITHEDIRFIAEVGANTIRLPFHYKLLTEDPYLGMRCKEDGYAIMDSCIAWCKAEGIHVILDMHDCPGGQTGDNIDDSYGYPWLFLSEASQAEFCRIWREIAERYKDEEAVLGYELMNEPIAHYFEADLDTLNSLLLPLYERCMAGIREVDADHIILLGAPQWNGNFRVPLVPCDSLNHNILYACHRYGHPADEEGIKDFLAFQDSLQVPMCMTETGHRDNEWYHEQAETLRRNHIGFLFWPYKKMGNSSWTGFEAPENWQVVRDFSKADRSGFFAIREARPDMALCRQILTDYLEAIRYENSKPDMGYIEALQLKK